MCLARATFACLPRAKLPALFPASSTLPSDVWSRPNLSLFVSFLFCGSRFCIFVFVFFSIVFFFNCLFSPHLGTSMKATMLEQYFQRLFSTKRMILGILIKPIALKIYICSSFIRTSFRAIYKKNKALQYCGYLDGWISFFQRRDVNGERPWRPLEFYWTTSNIGVSDAEDLKPRAAAGGQGIKFYANHLLHKRGRYEDKRQSLHFKHRSSQVMRELLKQPTYPPQD